MEYKSIFENKKQKEIGCTLAPSVEELVCLQFMGLSPKQILEVDKNKVREIIAHAENTYAKAVRILKQQADAGVKTISYYDENYPRHFKENLGDDAPPLLHLLGNPDLLYREDCITIIGARKADKEGCDAAYRLAYDFAKKGHPIVSGLALGCDTAAHRGCLDGGGQTVAIVASGLNITHPKENKSLQEEIIRQGGLILSEHPFGVKANPTRLVARCRMQVVLSRQVIVAQCPIVSGTMYAVHFAQEYDGDLYGWENELYAVEYNSYNEKSSGNQFLLEHKLAIPIKINTLWKQ